MHALIRVLVAVSLATSAAGCATILASKQSNVLVIPPDGHAFGPGVTVTDNGAPAVFTIEDGVDLCSQPCTQHHWVIPPGTLAVTVNAREDHHLKVTYNGQTGDVDVGTHASVGYFFLDLFTSGPIGITVDWVTHAWRSPDPAIVWVRLGSAQTARR